MNSATWPLRDIARAADMKPKVLRQLFDTGVLKFRGDDKHKTGSGVKVGLCRNRAIEAAIVQNLKLHGVSVSRGAKAAFEFTNSGNNGRRAGGLFPLGRSVLILGPSDSVVIQADYDANIFDLSNCGVAICLDLNAIVARVDAALNQSK
jgi:hypothetical protein